MHPLTASRDPRHREPLVRGDQHTLVDLMLARCDDAIDRPACIDGLGGTVLTWGELLQAALDLAERFEASGLKRGDRLAHLGPQSLEWIMVDLACLLSGIVHVSLHADAGPREQLANLSWLVPRGIAFSGGQQPLATPPGLIVVDVPRVAGRIKPATAAEIRQRLAARAADAVPDAPATIVLSSGTTGLPKGIVHCQRALARNAIASADMFLDEPDDVRLAWLPMSHLLARVGDLFTALVRGGCLNVVSDRTRVLDACRRMPPTVILGVPAFFERLERGLAAGRIGDLATALGGRVRVCVSGGAPLRRRTAECFARQGVPLVEGYGLAEAGPVVSVANPRITRPGAVGLPLAGVDVRIDTRPESRGQVLVRTPCRAVAVIEPLRNESMEPMPDRDSWLETGDVGTIDPDGQLRITGRLSEVVVLATGVKLPPAEVEAALAEDEAVAQVCVIGDGCPWPVALVVPEPAVIRAAIRRMGVRVASRAAALRHPRVLEWIARRLARRQENLPRAWRVRRVVLVGRPFDAARGEATESLKLKRPVIADHFQWVIDAVHGTAATAEGFLGRPTPAWMAIVPAASQLLARDSRARGWLAPAVWHGASDDGFAFASRAAVVPLRDSVAAVLEQSDKVIRHLRETGELYEPLEDIDRRRPPIADAPTPPTGLFSRTAEEALGDAGLWGLAVPEAFGGTGCSMQELARVITRIAADVPTAAGMLSLHSSIGAVTALVAFGTPDQQARLLPGLARGRPLSIFGGTEPDAGCDLAAAVARIERIDGRLLLTGTKMFITGATHGRLVKVLAKLDGRPCVALVRLPATDTPSFRLIGYPLHPLKHAANNALEFTRFEIEERDMLEPPPGGTPDAMKIVWHGLNRGRVTLAAQAAGTLRILLSQAARYATERRTWGEPIAARELVQGRLGRIAASIVACDSLAAWAATAIDAGHSGELEAIAAKVVASQCVREAAIDALGVHGGRAFLVGHALGDSFHDHFAVTIYEGESDLLGLALFKGLVKHHPCAAAVSGRRAMQWLAWRVSRLAASSRGDALSILDSRLRGHAREARRRLGRMAVRIDRAIRHHGRGLADRQLLVAQLSSTVRDLMSVVATAHWADAQGDDVALLAGDCWCRLALARAAGQPVDAATLGLLASLGLASLPR